MRYRSRPRRGARKVGVEDSLGGRSDLPIEPLRSMTLGDESSSSVGASSPRFGSGQPTDSSDLGSSGAWVRPEPGWEDQPSNFRRRSRMSGSGLFRRAKNSSGQGMRSRLLLGGLAATVLLGGTAAVAMHQRNAGNNAPATGQAANPPAAVTALPSGGQALGTPLLPPPAAAGVPSAASPVAPAMSAPMSVAGGAGVPSGAPTTQMALSTLHPTAAAGGMSGRNTFAVLGSTNFPNSTTVFVSCSGPPAVLSYQLDGQFTRLTGVAGLTGNATPGDLITEVSISGDGRKLATEMVSLDRSGPVSVNLTGVRALTVSAQRVSGTCRDAGQPYAVLGSAMLRR